MPEQDDAATAHSFEDCPLDGCGGDLAYPTQADVLCQDCESMFVHEIRGSGHLLWRFTHDDGLTEVVARAE